MDSLKGLFKKIHKENQCRFGTHMDINKINSKSGTKNTSILMENQFEKEYPFFGKISTIKIKESWCLCKIIFALLIDQKYIIKNEEHNGYKNENDSENKFNGNTDFFYKP